MNFSKRNANAGKSRDGKSSIVKMKKGGDLINRSIPLFPARKKAFLPYFDYNTVTAGAGVVGSYVFSCNGLYDPNITGVGHQPMGFDQMMTFYDHYTVLRAKIIIDFLYISGSGNLMVTVATRAALTPVTDPTQLIESGMIDYKLLSENLSNEKSRCRLSRTVDIRLFGGIDDPLDNPDYRGTVAANPAEQSYFHISIWNSAGTTCSAGFFAVIEFEAVFTEPRTPSTSLENKSQYRSAIPVKVEPTTGNCVGSVSSSASHCEHTCGGEYTTVTGPRGPCK